MSIEGRIRKLEVHTPAGLSGRLLKNAHFTFNYVPDATTEHQVSVTMQIRDESYTRGALFPIFEMNLPEGFVRHYVYERLRKTAPVDDMLFLALSGDNGIGRLRYRSEQFEQEDTEVTSLEEILESKDTNALFTELVETHLLRTSVGVSGIQPKVVVPEYRGTLSLPSLILKSGNAEYPNIALNEFLCMSIAKHAGLRTPEFWLSSDSQLFVMRRFDILASGEKLGMEDFSVLMAKPGDKKYEARYESLMRAGNLYEVDTTEVFEQIALSMVVGNGDAHLKNFAILYEDIRGPFWLSPIYDVVCTKPYGDETVGLSINGSRNYPNKSYLEKLGKAFGVKNPREILDRIGTSVSEVVAENLDLISENKAGFIQNEILNNRDQVMLTTRRFA